MKTDPHPQPLTVGQKAIVDMIPMRAPENRTIYDDRARLNPVAPTPPRDREADRARFPDPDFNRWLDESVTENAEFTVWHTLAHVADAWAGWNCRASYAAPGTRATMLGEMPVSVSTIDSLDRALCNASDEVGRLLRRVAELEAAALAQPDPYSEVAQRARSVAADLRALARSMDPDGEPR